MFYFHDQGASNSLHEWHILHAKSYFHNEKLKEKKETDLEAKLTSIHNKKKRLQRIVSREDYLPNEFHLEM